MKTKDSMEGSTNQERIQSLIDYLYQMAPESGVAEISPVEEEFTTSELEQVQQEVDRILKPLEMDGIINIIDESIEKDYVLLSWEFNKDDED